MTNLVKEVVQLEEPLRRKKRLKRIQSPHSINQRRKVDGQNLLQFFPSNPGRLEKIVKLSIQVYRSDTVFFILFSLFTISNFKLSGDGTYYDAKIEEITTDGEVSVKFKGFKGTFVTSLGLLKLPSSGTTTVHATNSAKNRKELLQHQKDQKKEKKKKHLENMKALEAEREKEKNKWAAFSSKAFGKKGFVKKSIFKTPESCDGRVGVGTCGMSGQKMTEFESAKKYRKGH